MGLMEPIPYGRPVRNGNPKLRWRPWYVAIADWQLRHPGGLMQDCAAFLGKSPTTLSIIVNSDMYKDYFAQRRAEFTKEHDFNLTHKLTQVAEKSLDILLEKIDTQKDKIPIKNITELATSALDRLGFAPKPPAAQVNVNVDARSQSVVMAPISPEALEEARDALRSVENQKIIEHRERELLPDSGRGDGLEAGQEQVSGVEATKLISDEEDVEL